MHLLLRFLISAAALYVTVLTGEALGLRLWLQHGLVGIEAAFVTALALGIVNAVIRPIVRLVALPITCLTLGLFSVVINAALFLLVGQYIHGFHVRGFIAALYGTVVMGFVGAVLNTCVISTAERKRGRVRLAK